MDRFISSLDAVEDGDLRLCHTLGVAYQADMTATIEYGDGYHDHYKQLEGTPIAEELNAARCHLLAKHTHPGASVLDIGAGCGTFVREARARGFDAKGFDVIPKTIDYLKSIDAWASDPAKFDAVTFWDSLEHIPDPGEWLRKIRKDTVLLAAIPVVKDLSMVRASRHYKPSEHFYYWKPSGFIRWMACYGFRLIEQSDHETKAGRESIGAFVFVRN